MDRPPHDLDALYRQERQRIFASLVRLLGDFDLAEEALHDAFLAAADQWPGTGWPANPRAWLVSAGRFRAIDRLRRRARFDAAQQQIAEALHAAPAPAESGTNDLGDDRLGLVFVCCHPALAPDAQVALTLREVCGLTTEAIAAAFLVPATTIAQRIVRAKARLRAAAIPFAVPAPAALAARLDPVLRVIYLVFNEGYSASSGEAALRPDLSAEAIRLGRLLVALLPEPEVQGLLALMLFHESRRAARLSPEGELVLIEDQDRRLWDAALIAEGTHWLETALASRRFGALTVQAAIAGLHAQPASAAATDWGEIVGLYDVLQRLAPSPLVTLNRAVALAMRDGPAAGLALVDALLARGELATYHHAHAARAELLRRLGQTAAAAQAYRTALALARQDPQRRHLARRLAALAEPHAPA